MRIWLRRKNKVTALHELDGSDTACKAVQCKGMNLENYERTGKVQQGERICSECQVAIAERRGKF
jgi:hypothetical protein